MSMIDVRTFSLYQLARAVNVNWCDRMRDCILEKEAQPVSSNDYLLEMQNN